MVLCRYELRSKMMIRLRFRLGGQLSWVMYIGAELGSYCVVHFRML